VILLKFGWLLIAVFSIFGGGCTETKPSSISHHIIFRQPGIYASHPAVFRGPDEKIWVDFGTNSVKSHYGAAAGGNYKSRWAYSPDGGRSWFVEDSDKEFISPPPRLPFLRLSDGTLISIGFSIFENVNKAVAEELGKRGIQIQKKWGDDLFSVSYRGIQHRKPENGKWEKTIIEPGLAFIQSYGRPIVSGNEAVLAPVFGRLHADDPALRSLVLRSEDEGMNWGTVTIAYDGFHNFGETSLLVAPNGTIMAMMRCDSNKNEEQGREGEGFLWESFSDDEGLTWSVPVKTPVWGYPPTLLLLRDGRILCSYGYRKPPYGIRACLSSDGGKTWEIEHEIILRDDGLSLGKEATSGDLGYPTTIQLPDNYLLTVYYFDLGDGVTHIAATRWALEQNK
jgi:hypothetical protein